MSRFSGTDIDHPGAAKRVEMGQASVGHDKILRPLEAGLGGERLEHAYLSPMRRQISVPPASDRPNRGELRARGSQTQGARTVIRDSSTEWSPIGPLPTAVRLNRRAGTIPNREPTSRCPQVEADPAHRYTVGSHLLGVPTGGQN
jgi:hypothetical protein